MTGGQIKKIQIGSIFGKWEVIKFVELRNHRAVYLCKCSCGNYREVLGQSLRSGVSRSCGCLHKQKVTKHSLWTNHLYILAKLHDGIKQRCLNPHNCNYKNYGARGITLCDEWLNDVKAFADWCLANGWRKGLQIDRVDVNGDYSPNNCRFVDVRTNINNRRNTRYALIDGKKIPFSEAREKYGLPINALIKVQVRK